MSNYIVKEHVEIENFETVCNRVEICINGKIDGEAMKRFMSGEKATCFFLDNKLNPVDEASQESVYAWVDTGYVKKDGSPVFVSLLNDGGFGFYMGDYVSDAGRLSQYIENYYPQNRKYIRGNVTKFLRTYKMKINEREVKHLTAADKGRESLTATIGSTTGISQIPEIRGTDKIDQTIGTYGTKAVGMESAPLIRNHADSVMSGSRSGRAEDQTSRSENPGRIISGGMTGNDGKLTDVTEDIYSDLLFPNWKSIYGLDRYLKVIGYRIMKLIEGKQTEYYVMNSSRSVVVNTGLMNRYGIDYKVMYRFHVKYQAYVAYQVMDTKSVYLENCFTREDAAAEIRPISFFDGKDALFCPDWADIDFEPRAMEHIVNERRERFPESVRQLSDREIAEKVRGALERGVRMQYRDRNYAKAIYSTQSRGISWLMPLHVKAELTEKPELVLVLRKCQGFYQVKTILPYDDEVQDRITAMSLYGRMW